MGEAYEIMCDENLLRIRKEMAKEIKVIPVVRSHYDLWCTWRLSILREVILKPRAFFMSFSSENQISEAVIHLRFATVLKCMVW